MSQTVPPGSISILGLIDKKSLDQIAESTGKKIWIGFVNFGSASAGVLGIFIVIRIAKLVVDTIIHGYALHSVYGWSLHLLGAIWTSLTNLLLHLGRPVPAKEKETTQNQEPQKDESTSSQTAVIKQFPTPPANENCNTGNRSYVYSHKELRQLLENNPRDDVPQVKIS